MIRPRASVREGRGSVASRTTQRHRTRRVGDAEAMVAAQLAQDGRDDLRKGSHHVPSLAVLLKLSELLGPRSGQARPSRIFRNSVRVTSSANAVDDAARVNSGRGRALLH